MRLFHRLVDIANSLLDLIGGHSVLEVEAERERALLRSQHHRLKAPYRVDSHVPPRQRRHFPAQAGSQRPSY